MTKILTSLKYLIGSFFYFVCTASVSRADDPMCPTLTEFIQEGTGGAGGGQTSDHCLLCGIYDVVMDACANVVVLSWNAFATPLQGVVAIGAAIYIAVYTLKNIASFSQQDPAAYLSYEKTGISPLCVKVAMVIWLLGNQSFLYSYIIGPVISAGLSVGGTISSAGGTLGVSGFGDVSNVRTLFQAVIDKVREFNDNVYQIVALGRLFLCLAFLPEDIFDWYWSLIFFGAVLYVFGWFILIGVSFYLLDVLFRLAVGCMLLPMAIACGVSKLTSKYTKKNWNLFVNVFFNFVMMGVLLTFTMEMIMEAAGGSDELIAEHNIQAGKQFTEADASALVENLDVSSFLLTTIACMVAFKLFMELEQLADKVSSTSSIGKLGKQSGALAHQFASAPIKKGLRENKKFAGAAIQTAKEDFRDSRRQTWQNIRQSPVGQAIQNSRVGKTVSKLRRALRI